MSKYTTEVRFICETAAGLSESKGYNDVNEIIANARESIFSFDYPIFDEEYRSVLETKILKHYYTREIGLETVGLWKLKLDMKMNEIMPYYNQLYESELLTFNPLYTINYTKTHSGNKNDSRNKNRGENESVNDTLTGSVNSSSNGTNNTNTITSNENLNVFSDTPQGALTDLEGGNYMTNATKATNSGSEGVMNTTSDQVATTTNDSRTKQRAVTGTETDQISTTDAYTDMVSGYNGKSPSKLIDDFRRTILNIDMMVINDLEPLFMQVF